MKAVLLWSGSQTALLLTSLLGSPESEATLIMGLMVLICIGLMININRPKKK